MPTPDEIRLLRVLECETPPGPAAPGARAAVRARDAGVRPFDAGTVAALREELLRDPARMMEHAPAVLGPSPSVDEGLRLLNAAEGALRNASGTLRAVAAARSDESFELPQQHRFPGYDHATIPIFPNRTQFETTADAAAWATTAAAAWFFRLVTRKPDLPVPEDGAVYPLRSRNGQTTVALFSDWGTGYSHSQYIARHIARLEVGQAVHLGDVYYTGTQEQFDRQVTPVLAPLLREMPVYALNANHEMDSEGIPYLGFLAEKRRLGGQPGFVEQPQETSYFCLVNDGYQVIAIDTAFERNGRYTKKALRAWLESRLREGADAGRLTILLSQNEPYGPRRFGGSVGAQEKRPLLVEDLQAFVEAGLVHAWFWGDEHYAALYEPNDQVPFVGSCVGHGGYPFGRKRDDSSAGDVARLVWTETGSRFEGIDGLREDRGNNGFCHLALREDQIELRYIDWRFRTRKEVALRRDGNRLRVA